MTEYVAVFLGGFLGSAHCVGMCGGLVALVGMPRCGKGQAIARQLIYSGGRIFTYTFLGVAAGALGAGISNSSAGLIEVQRFFSIGAGAVMVLIGLSTLGLVKLRFALPPGVVQPLATVFRQFLNGPGGWTIFLAGVLNGFLPCGLVYAFLALALAAGHAVDGGLLMTVFGLGTVPAMTVVGCGSTMVSHHSRARIYRLAACLVVFTGGVTIYRAIPSRVNCCSGDDPVSAQVSADLPP